MWPRNENPCKGGLPAGVVAGRSWTLGTYSLSHEQDGWRSRTNTVRPEVSFQQSKSLETVGPDLRPRRSPRWRAVQRGLGRMRRGATWEPRRRQKPIQEGRKFSSQKNGWDRPRRWCSTSDPYSHWLDALQARPWRGDLAGPALPRVPPCHALVPCRLEPWGSKGQFTDHETVG